MKTIICWLLKVILYLKVHIINISALLKYLIFVIRGHVLSVRIIWATHKLHWRRLRESVYKSLLHRLWIQFLRLKCLAFSHHINLLYTTVGLRDNMCFAFAFSLWIRIYLSDWFQIGRTLEIRVVYGLIPKKLIPIIVIRILKWLILCVRVFLNVLWVARILRWDHHWIKFNVQRSLRMVIWSKIWRFTLNRVSRSIFW